MLMIFRKKIFYLFLIWFLVGAPFYGNAAQLGETITFNVSPNYESRQRSQLSSFLKKISQTAYFYVDQAYWDSLEPPSKNDFETALDALALKFDQNIYPNAVALFGSEWKPGIDNDERLTVLLMPLRQQAGGYTNTGDEFPKTSNPDSNEREMTYLNALLVPQGRADVFLAHEFQHLISFFQKDKLLRKNEDVWLNEVRSEYVPTYLNLEARYRGSHFEGRARQFLSSPSDSLTEWSETLNDYGSVSMFAHYAADHFGSSFFSELMKSDKVGIESVNDALKRLGFNRAFSDVFADWTIANYLNDPRVENGRYAYKNPNLAGLKVSPNFSLIVSSLPVSLNFSTKDWTPRWYQFDGTGQGILKLEFSATGANVDFRVPYVVSDVSGQHAARFLELTRTSEGQIGTLYLQNFGPQIRSVAVSPYNQYKVSNFTANDPSVNFSLTASIVTEMPVAQIQALPAAAGSAAPAASLPNVADGTLIRAKGDYKVYIVKGTYKRHILNPQIFSMYRHFDWAAITELSSDEVARYATSALVRAENDPKVYEINDDATKHWLNMSAESFALSGRSWDSISIINKAERDFYRTGADVRYYLKAQSAKRKTIT